MATWKCEQCTLVQTVLNNTCEVCGAIRTFQEVKENIIEEKEIKDNTENYEFHESDDDVVVYIFGSENRRIVINDILFTDYFEVTEQEKLKEVGDSYFTTWKEHAILESEDNVKIRSLNDDTTTTMAAE